ncbi:MAG: serine hydrolase domain-containing protein, partial [Bacteroidota bacterium]
GYAQGEDVPDVIQILDGEEPANSPKIFPDTLPGAIYRYSGGGYTVMQKFMEDQTGQRFAEILKSRVLDKTGMKNSTYQQPLPSEMHAQAAHGYRGSGEKVEGEWHTYPEQAAAGLWTTPSDLAHFAISVQKAYHGSTEEFISPETAKQMLTVQVANHGLGPGLNVKGDTLWFGHGGANEGFRCQLFANVQLFNDQGLAIMTNSDNGSNIAFEMIQALSEYYKWDLVQARRRTAISLDKEALQKFVGHYIYEEDYQMDIYLGENGHLQMHQIWDDQTIELRAEEELKFFETTTGIYLQFHLSEEGEISHVDSNGYTAQKTE